MTCPERDEKDKRRLRHFKDYYKALRKKYDLSTDYDSLVSIVNEAMDKNRDQTLTYQTGSMNYWIAAATYSNGMSAIKKDYKIIDFHQVVGASCGQGTCAGPQGSFVSDCNAAGISPVLNNSNDQGGGCSGSSAASYYAGLKKDGIMAAGGEVDCAAEMAVCMGAGVIAMNYGGALVGNGTINVFVQDDCGTAWKVTSPGCASYLETYDGGGTIWEGWGGISAAAPGAKAAGCLEVGLLLAGESNAEGIGTAEEVISCMESCIDSLGFCSGAGLWDGCGSDSAAMLEQFGDYYDEMQAAGTYKGQSFAPNTTTTIDKRFSGTSPTPTPTPTPIGSAPNTNLCVRVRAYQPGVE
jgi:hypothetical protein